MGSDVTLLALDPSLCATGWVVFDLGTDAVLGAGVIRTKPTPKAKRQLLTEDDTRRGLALHAALAELCERWAPVIAAKEGEGGGPSRRARSSATQARGHQAADSAVYAHLGAGPLIYTPQALKQAACGVMTASKDDVEAAVRERLPADWDALLADVAPTKRENAFDAGAAYLAAYENPAVAAMRQMARRAG